MSCEYNSIYDCIQAVCAESRDLQKEINDATAEVQWLRDELIRNGEAVKCVVNGAEGAYCDLPEGGVLPTMATRLSGLNACTVSNIVAQQFTSAQGQTVFNLSTVPSTDAHLETALDGAICSIPNDYTRSGAQLTFMHALDAGDTVDVRIFQT